MGRGCVGSRSNTPKSWPENQPVYKSKSKVLNSNSLRTHNTQ